MPPNASLNTYADEVNYISFWKDFVLINLQHAGLLQVINKYDGVQAALKDATDLLASVQQELAARNERLKDLTKKRFLAATYRLSHY